MLWLTIQLHPGLDLISTVGPMPSRDDFDLQAYQETLNSLGIPPFPQVKIPDEASSSAPSPSILGPSPWKKFERDPNRPSDDTQGEGRIHSAMIAAMDKLQMKDEHWRFHGKASGAHLMHMITELKYKSQGGYNHFHPTFLDGLAGTKREQYWRVPEWEKVIAQDDIRPVDWSIWPVSAQELIDAYFNHVNFHLPLLNRVIFQRDYNSGLYRTNVEFAKICLMVFANGARFVDLEEVYWPTDLATTEEGRERLRRDQDGSRKYSAGWKYLRAIMKMGKSIMQAPGLYEFQCTVLICVFLQGSAVPHLMWLLSGFGLRSAQELGIHVRSTMIHVDPIERALCNRAFWCLYHIDRLNCAAIGRSVALQDTDFDADYPIAVDDEYWEQGFVQPEGVLPQISAFIHLLKLDHVIGAALRTIYAVSAERARREVVVELDSALNSWADDVPDGLRWDPTRSDERLFQQSAVLYAHYYYCQILIHRPFIPTPSADENIGLPSLAICSNASRSIANILDAVLRRGRQNGKLPGQSLDVAFMLPAMVAVIILLVGIYLGNQQPRERERAIADVKKCMAAIRDIEVTWRMAGKLTDFLVELSSEHNLPNDTQQPRGEKRTREVEMRGKTADAAPPFKSNPQYDVIPSSNEEPIAAPNFDSWGAYLPVGNEQSFVEPIMYGSTPILDNGFSFMGDEGDLWTQLFGSYT